MPDPWQIFITELFAKIVAALVSCKVLSKKLWPDGLDTNCELESNSLFPEGDKMIYNKNYLLPRIEYKIQL